MLHVLDFILQLLRVKSRVGSSPWSQITLSDSRDFHRRSPESGDVWYRGTSPTRKRPPPLDPPKTLGIGSQ